jgi:mRNA interferase RelE/StbE
MYEINFTINSYKEFKKLERKTQKHIIAVIERIRIRPEHYFQKIVGGIDYKVRVGDYRLIADLNFEKKFILITKIGHRKKIYKNL